MPRRPAQPTDARPGSIKKICAMARRLAAGEELWHPQDRQSDGWVPGVEDTGNRFRARLRWRGKTYTIGYYYNREDASSAVREWRSLSDRIGPEKATEKIRAKLLT